MKKAKPNQVRPGDLRVWNIINVPNEPVRYPVKDVGHGARLIEALADSQLLDKTIESNVFGLEIYEDGEWLEWESEDGDDIQAWAENNLESRD
jgi:hypothetical protein